MDTDLLKTSQTARAGPYCIIRGIQVTIPPPNDKNLSCHDIYMLMRCLHTCHNVSISLSDTQRKNKLEVPAQYEGGKQSLKKKLRLKNK